MKKRSPKAAGNHEAVMHYVVLQSAVITVSFRQSLAKRRFQYADDGTRRKAAERLHRAVRARSGAAQRSGSEAAPAVEKLKPGGEPTTSELPVARRKGAAAPSARWILAQGRSACDIHTVISISRCRQWATKCALARSLAEEETGASHSREKSAAAVSLFPPSGAEKTRGSLLLTLDSGPGGLL